MTAVQLVGITEAQVSVSLTPAQLQALTRRPDLLACECRLIRDWRRTWAWRASTMSSYGRSGGSAADRRLIVEAMAALEQASRCPV